MENERTTPPPAQQALPFDDEADRPVPYALTVRARREVAPHALPDLEVVRPDAVRPRAHEPAGEGALEEPGDTRPARARALRRAGVGLAQIVQQLQADELAVRAWLGDLAGGPPRAGASVVALPGSASRGPDPAILRARAAEHARARLEEDPGFAAGLGLFVGVGQLDAHGVGLSTTDPRLAATVVAWLVQHAGVAHERVRVVLRLGDRVAGDLARHEWSRLLGVPLERVTHTRWRGGTDPEAVEALVRVTDERLAATLSGWEDALLAGPRSPVDAAF
jgi:hypothetical protein